MPTYPILDKRTGKRYKMPWDSPGKPDRESVRKFVYEQENRTVFDKTRDWLAPLNEPLSDLPSRISKKISEPLYEYGMGKGAKVPVLGRAARVGGAFTESLGDIGSSLTSPTSLALFGLTGGTGTATRLGFGRTAGGLIGAQRAAGAGLTAHGAYNVATGETAGERLGGAVEALGGAVGMRYPYRGRAPASPSAQRPLSPTPRYPAIPELPPAPSLALLPSVPTRLALPPGRRTFYSGRRGTSENLEDVGEFIAPASRQVESIRGPGINITGARLEDFPAVAAPRVPAAPTPRTPTPKLAPATYTGPEQRYADFGPPQGVSERRMTELQEKFGGTKTKPEARDSAIKSLNERLKKAGWRFGPGDEGGGTSIGMFGGGTGGELRKAFRNVYDDLATSGLTVIKNLGGGDLENLILRNRLDAEQLAGRLVFKLKAITKDLTQEELDSYINVRDTGARPLNQKVSEAVSKFKDVDADVVRMAKMSGMGLRRGKKVVPFEGLGKEGAYFPHIYGPEFFKNKKKALKAIMDDGYTLEQAERILRKAREHGERLIDPQHARVVNAPGYRKDINVDYQHIDDMSRRIKQAIDFGPLDTAALNSPISRMIAATDDPPKVAKIVKRYLGREEPMDPSWARVNRAVVKFQTATKLSKFFINNMAQLGMIPTIAGPKSAAKGLARKLFDPKEAESIARQTGALQPIHRELVREAGGPDGIARLFGISKGEEFTRTIAAVAGRHTAQDLFKKLQRNPTDMRTRKRLSDLVLDNPDKLLEQGNLTDWQINRAGARMSEITQGRASSIDLPQWWTSNPSMRLIMLYKRYAFQQSKNIKKAIDIVGPVRVATTIVGMSMVLGEGIGDINAALRGIGRTIGGSGDLEDEIVRAIQERGEGYERIVNNLAQMWALGYVGDLFESSARSREGTAANLSGPVVGDIGETAFNLSNLDARGLAAQGARMVPLFGTGLASAIRESRGRRRRRRRRRSRRTQ